jgi:hypothetical protein
LIPTLVGILDARGPNEHRLNRTEVSCETFSPRTPRHKRTGKSHCRPYKQTRCCVPLAPTRANAVNPSRQVVVWGIRRQAGGVTSIS